MIRPLRRLHRRAAALSAIGLPVLVVAALSSRPGAPAPSGWPEAPAPPAAEGADGPWVELAGGAARARKTSSPAGAPRLDLEVTGALASPDLLVYWQADAGSLDPATSWLLGPAPAAGLRSWPLPSPAPGTLALYSLGHGRVVAEAALPPGLD